MTPNRRDRFREYMTRLNPTEDPERALNAGFYIPPPDSAGARIARRLEIEPASSHLLVGGIGTGKTTELLAVQRALSLDSGLRGILVSVPSRHEVTQLKPGVLMALAAWEASVAAEEQLDTMPNALNHSVLQIKREVQGQWVEPELFDDPDYLADRPPGVWRPGVVHEPEIHEVIEHLEELATSIVSALEIRPVLLFDGLDRLADVSSFASIIAYDVPAIVRAGMGVVVVGPQHLRFGHADAAQERFTSFHLHGAASLAGPEGIEFLTGVLRARVDAEFLPDDACRELAAWSGGVLRDLISLARTTGEEAYVSGADQVEVAHVQTAADRFGRALLLGITPAMAKRLKDFVPKFGKPKELQFTLSSESDIALLLGRLIVEVPGTPVRYVPHPAVVPLVAGLDAAQ
jgi:hypothetical protein